MQIVETLNTGNDIVREAADFHKLLLLTLLGKVQGVKRSRECAGIGGKGGAIGGKQVTSNQLILKSTGKKLSLTQRHGEY